MKPNKKLFVLIAASLVLFILIPCRAYCSELPTLEAESDILAEGEDPDTQEGLKAMSKALNSVSALIVMVGVITIALSVFNLIIAMSDQTPARLATAKISLGIGVALVFIVPIMKAIGLIK